MIKKDKAFTLVELLVVVAVLALLASVVFSNLTGAREQAKISNALSFQSNMHNLLGVDLVGWWNFDEGSGNTANDLSGYGNNGTLSDFDFNDSSGWSNDTPSPGGYSLKFDGVNDYLILGNKIGSFIDNSVTISAWIKPDSSGSREISNQGQWDGGPWTGWRFRQISSRINLKIGDNTLTSYELSAGTLEFGNWQHVVGSWDGSYIKLYIDGLNVGNEAKELTLQMNSGQHYIGKYAGNAYFFNGLIDDVRIYSRALTAYEVQTLYAQTKDNYLSNRY